MPSGNLVKRYNYMCICACLCVKMVLIQNEIVKEKQTGDIVPIVLLFHFLSQTLDHPLQTLYGHDSEVRFHLSNLLRQTFQR